MQNKASTVRWRLLSVLIFASFVSYMLRSNISIAAPVMIKDLALSEVQWGWVLAAFTTGYALCQIPGGVLGDRFGPRRVLTLIAILWSVLTIVTSLVPGTSGAGVVLTLVSLITVRFLIGVAHAPIFPVTNCAIERWFPSGGRAFPTGLTSTGLTLGFAAAAPLLVWLIAQWGWRWSFLVVSPFGFSAALLWWWYARDEPADHHGTNAAELALIEGDCDLVNDNPADDESADEALKASWQQLLANRDILLLTLSYACMNFVFYDVFNWFFYYLVTVRDFAATDAGFMTSTQWIAGAIGAASGGWICDRLCVRFGLRWGCRWPIIFGMVLSGMLLFIGAISASVTLAVGALALCFFFNQMTEGPYWAASMAIGGRSSGTAGGVLNTGANMMGIINALLVPGLAALFGWTFAMSAGGFFALLGASLMLLVRADRPFYAT